MLFSQSQSQSQSSQFFPVLPANSLPTSALRSSAASLGFVPQGLARNGASAALSRSRASQSAASARPISSRTNAATTPSTETNPAGTLSFSYYNYRVSEGAGMAMLKVERTGDSEGAVTVAYSTGRRNTATAGRDFVATSGVLTFNPGETSKTIEVPLLADEQFESAEVVRVGLSNPTGGATLGRQSGALLTILNDDMPTETQIQQRSTNRLTVGETTFYVGHNQVANGSAIGNKDPWVASFSQGRLNWYRDDYEVTPDDGMATHLLWDDRSAHLYVAFTATGTQGAPTEDYRRFATNGWLRSYTDGSPHGGGGGRVAVLARMQPVTGEVTHASFLTARNGMKTNSMMVRSLAMNGSNLVVRADTAFAPRRADKTAMTRNATEKVSPNYTIEFTSDLSTVVRAESENYS